MANLIKLDTKEYPVSIATFKERFKQTSFPKVIPFESFGYAVVFDVPQPAHTRLQRAKELPPEISKKGTWQQVWIVVDLRDEMTPEEYEKFLKSLADQDAKAASDKAKAELLEIDKKTIRSLREYIAALPDAPAFTKKHEADAVKARKDVIKET